MKRFISAVYALVLVLVLSNLVWAEEFIRVKGLYWNGLLDGKVKADTELTAGTKIDLRQDLHTDLYTNIPALEIKLNFLGLHKIKASYWQTDYDGEKNLLQSINYGGKVYGMGENVKTNLDLTSGSILYERSFVPESLSHAFPSIAEAEFGVWAGLEYLVAESKISSSTTGLSNSETVGIPIPVVGLFTRIGFLQKQLLFETGIVGVGGKFSDYTFSFVDAYAELKVNITKFIPLGIGYKFVGLKVEKSNNNDSSVDLSLDGCYLFTSIGY